MGDARGFARFAGSVSDQIRSGSQFVVSTRFFHPNSGYLGMNPGYRFAGKPYTKPANTASLGRQPVRELQFVYVLCK
jgi:hypothetical protein